MRIRSIKPEFYKSDDIDALTWDQRLVFIGLWSYVDDNGVGINKLSSIVSDLFSADHFRDPQETVRRVSSALSAIEKQGLITRYRAKGKPFLYVVKWDSHQRVTHPNNPRFPRPSGDSGEPQEDSRESPENLVPVTGVQGSRGTGVQGSRGNTSSKDRTSEPDAAFGLFWDAYGKKVGRGQAWKAWRTACKKADEEDIITAAISHAKWHESERTEQRYIPNASTWLNGERWTDERRVSQPKRTAGDQRVHDALSLAQRLNDEPPQPHLRAIGQNQ